MYFELGKLCIKFCLHFAAKKSPSYHFGPALISNLLPPPFSKVIFPAIEFLAAGFLCVFLTYSCGRIRCGHSLAAPQPPKVQP
jgi:hypothetical protein